MNSNFAQKWYFCDFIVNSSVLFTYLFLTTGSDYIRSGRHPIKKKAFSKKNIFGKILKFLLLFFIRLYKGNYQKIFFGFLPSFDQNVLKMIFEHNSCAKPYSFGYDGPNLFKLCSKWPQWHKLQINREFFLNLRLEFWKIRLGAWHMLKNHF